MGQADATTAGKTCINSTFTKNIIGTYYLPRFVYSNVCYLKDLPLFEHRQGISEIFKYGLLGSRKLIKLLQEYVRNYDYKLLVNILTNTIKVRISLRKKNGLISNLGHTFGHAIEKTSKYKVAHGDAISVGILLALKFSLEKKIISLKFYNKIKNLMYKLKINTHIDAKFKIDEILNVMMMDKKSKYNLIGLVLIKNISRIISSPLKPFFYIKKNEMKKFLTKNLKNISKKNHWIKLRKNEV
jgi:3-dehydroquinate synthetase